MHRLLVRPETLVFEAHFVLLQMFLKIYFLFMSTRYLQASSADRSEILHDDQQWTEFYNAGPKFRGGGLAKFMGQNMQNLARFRTTSNYGGEYLWNE